MICVHWENCREPDVMIFKTATKIEAFDDGTLVIHNGDIEDVAAVFAPGVWKAAFTDAADIEPKQGKSL